MRTYLSNKELQAIEEELDGTPESVSTFTLTPDQVSALVAEVIANRGIRREKTQVKQIDLFDTSNYR